ncbi:hypothetical protein C8J56DRAFT_846422 [Mycena floridula]|nr:hypothetical protein C8J56DRAFT_846422 [Mycena floridula]
MSSAALPEEKFPQEIIDTIIDFWHDDPPLLAICSLVSRKWLPSSRFHIYKAVIFRDVPGSLKFLDLLGSTHETMSSSIRSLEFRSRGAWEGWKCGYRDRWNTGRITRQVKAGHEKLLRCLVDHIRTVRIDDILVEKAQALSDTMPFRNVTAVDLRYARFQGHHALIRFISGFRSLEELSFKSSALTFHFDIVSINSPLTIPPRRLRILRMVSAEEYLMVSLLSWMIPYVPEITGNLPSGIKVLSCIDLTAASFVTLANFMKILENHLESLELSTTPQTVEVLGGQEFRSLMDFSGHTRLRSLHFHLNSFSSGLMQWIPESLATLNTLQTLIISVPSALCQAMIRGNADISGLVLLRNKLPALGELRFILFDTVISQFKPVGIPQVDIPLDIERIIREQLLEYDARGILSIRSLWK